MTTAMPTAGIETDVHIERFDLPALPDVTDVEVYEWADYAGIIAARLRHTGSAGATGTHATGSRWMSASRPRSTGSWTRLAAPESS
jgi:hypothetical protein